MYQYSRSKGVSASFLKSAIDNPDKHHCIDMSFEANTWLHTELPNTADPASDPNKDYRIQEYEHNLQCEEYVRIMEEREIPLSVITSRYDLGPRDVDTNHSRCLLTNFGWHPEIGRSTHKLLPEQAKIVSWKHRWVHGAVTDFGSMLNGTKHLPGNQDIEDPWNEANTKLYVSMMHIPKPHRIALMDYLFDENRIVHGEVRFCNNTEQWHKLCNNLTQERRDTGFLSHPNASSFMHNLILSAPSIFSPYKYHRETYLNPNHPDRNWVADPAYSKGVIALEAETLTDLKFITQKSYMPTLWKKPFCILGNANANNEMKKMGYELFDELFDYSGETEDIDSLHREPEGVASSKFAQFDRYKSHYAKLCDPLWNIPRTRDSYKAICEDLKEKIEHNLNRTVELVFDNDLIPEEVFKYAHGEESNAKQVVPARELILRHPYFEKYRPLNVTLDDIRKFPS